MSAKHGDPEYRKNARIIRQGVAKRRKAGDELRCWRCGGLIDEEQAYDVGHIDPGAGHDIGNLAPEHRYKSGRCQGNRSNGGRLGRARQTQHHAASKGLLPW
jgi:hypothetical protein